MNTSLSRPLLLSAAMALAGCNAATPVQPNSAPSTVSTFTLSGTVTGPGGIGLSDARVSAGTKVVQTDDLGRYTLTGLWGNVRVAAEKSEYEKQYAYASMFSDLARNFSLQQTIRIEAGNTAVITMLAEDPAYDLDTGYSVCPAPCKVIRVVSSPGPAMTVSIGVRARDGERRLQLFVDDGMQDFSFTGEKQLSYSLNAGGEAVFHVRFFDAVAGADPRIDIATSFQSR